MSNLTLAKLNQEIDNFHATFGMVPTCAVCGSMWIDKLQSVAADMNRARGHHTHPIEITSFYGIKIIVDPLLPPNILHFKDLNGNIVKTFAIVDTKIYEIPSSWT